eukprot:m.22977 g.22977  ORF g.22977 m.22977 type:complete len:86 (-) comp10872_c0_seq1:1593-1850(-)
MCPYCFLPLSVDLLRRHTLSRASTLWACMYVHVCNRVGATSPDTVNCLASEHMSPLWKVKDRIKMFGSEWLMQIECSELFFSNSV